MFRSSVRSSSRSSLFISLSMLLTLKIIKIFKNYYQSIVVMWQHKFSMPVMRTVWRREQSCSPLRTVEVVRNLVAHGDAREGKWRGNWRIDWVASTLTPPPNVVYAALLKLMRTNRLPVVDWTDVPCRFKWTRPFRGKTKSDFCACHHASTQYALQAY